MSELKLVTKYDRRFILQSWESSPVEDSHFRDIRSVIQQRMVDMEDAGVRQALMSMGWTPPDGSPKVVFQDKEDGLWISLSCDGKYSSFNLNSIRTARWFVEAYRNGRVNEGPEVVRPIP